LFADEDNLAWTDRSIEQGSERMAKIETGTDDLLGRIDGHVAVLSFNRPERRNALSASMYDGFGRALPQIERHPSVRVLLLTGEGGAFCAGGDVKGMHENNTSDGGSAQAGASASSLEDRVAWLRSRQALVSLALRHLPMPVVAALPGAAAGAGLSMALAADLRIAAERAVLVTAFANVGASGDFGTSWFLPRIVGEAKAKELMFTSPRLTAAEAADLGLVNQVLADDGFAEAALAYCHGLANRAPIALRYMKENVNRALGVTLSEALDAEASAMVRTMGTADHREAAAAFVEKRPPEFAGH
jgi:2-(1,2-epoxy-1,2-dihydrophenyl)acetyl-CoA isomerase